MLWESLPYNNSVAVGSVIKNAKLCRRLNKVEDRPLLEDKVQFNRLFAAFLRRDWCYLDDPEATAAAMTPDGWYNTNDVASMDRDGYIRITGRLSRFSKIGGEMVPHELIENRLEEFYGLEGKVAVTARPDSRKGEQLVVFYAADCGLDPVDAGNRLRESGLPNLWVPRPDCFFPLEKIPFLGNGKKDLKKLRELALKAGQ